MSTRAESTVLSNNSTSFSRMKTYFMWRLEDMRQQLIILIICSAFSIPLLCMLLNPDYDSGANGDLRIALVMLVIASFSGLVIILYMNALNCFDYLWKKSVTDVRLSLPLSHRERFCADFMAGLLPSVVLYIASSAVGFGILMITKFNIKSSDRLFFILDKKPEVIIAIFIGGLVSIIFFYCLIVFSVSLCGRFFEAAIMPFFVSVLIPVVPVISILLMYANINIVSVDKIVTDIAMCVSPFAFVIGVFYYLPVVSMFYRTPLAMRPEIILPVIFVALILTIFAYFLIKYRKSEQVGRGILNKAVFHSVITLLTFAITALFCALISSELYMDMQFEKAVENGLFTGVSGSLNTNGYIVALIVSTLIIFLLYDIVFKRGIRKPLLCIGRYAVTLVGSVLVCVGFINVNGFGIQSYVPNADDVESVTVDSLYMFENSEFARNNFDDMYNYFEPQSKFVFTERENIDIILQTHKICTENLNYYNSTAIIVEYKMKNGSTKEFYLRISDELGGEETKLAEQLYYSKEYRKAVLNYVSVASEHDFIENKQTNINNLVNHYTNNVYDTDNFEKLFEAFKKDYLSETYEINKDPETGIIGYVEFAFSNSKRIDSEYMDGAYYSYNIYPNSIIGYKYKFAITSHYTNFLAAMNELGMEFPTLQKDTENYSISLTTNRENLEQNKILLNDLILDGNEDVLKLMSALKGLTVGDNTRGYNYWIQFNQEELGSHILYGIPNEYNDIAERVFGNNGF